MTATATQPQASNPRTTLPALLSAKPLLPCPR